MNIKKLITVSEIGLAIIPSCALFILFFAWMSYILTVQIRWLIVETGDRFASLGFGCCLLTGVNVALGIIKSEIK